MNGGIDVRTALDVNTQHVSSELEQKRIRKNTKLYYVLAALIERSYNRFEAERLLHDHALHSTVSIIQNKYGVHVERCYETVSGFQGHPTRVSRYWILPSQHERVYALLGLDVA